MGNPSDLGGGRYQISLSPPAGSVPAYAIISVAQNDDNVLYGINLNGYDPSKGGFRAKIESKDLTSNQITIVLEGPNHTANDGSFVPNKGSFYLVVFSED